MADIVVYLKFLYDVKSLNWFLDSENIWLDTTIIITGQKPTEL